MAKFLINDRVMHISSNEEGIITKVFPAGRGKQLYEVNVNGLTKNWAESYITPLLDITDPVERIKQGVFGSNLEFARINTSNKLSNATNSTISSLRASKTIFKAYQFKPLLKFLNSENRRLLIADEVGLGKTIEAGHIMFEMYARGELKNSLIICPKSLQEKWQTELRDKFNLYFKIYESTKDLINDIKSSGAKIKAIVNYERIRPEKEKKQTKEEKQSKQPQPKKTEKLIDVIANSHVKFDFVVFDEAHKLRNKETQTYAGAEKIIEHSNAVIMLTATPIMISEENLYNLLHLLNRVRYSSYHIFKSSLDENKPFIKALYQLNSKTMTAQEIVEELSESKVVSREFGYTTIGELREQNPIFNKIKKDVCEQEDSIKLRMELQANISSLNQMNTIFSRTRKKDITQDWSQAIREPHTHPIRLYPEEQVEFDRVIDEYSDDNTFIDENGCDVMMPGTSLGLVQKKRMVASSVYGYLNTTASLNAGIDRYAECKDAKFEDLLKIVEEIVVKRKKKLIIFALFKNTLKYLNIRLQKNKFKTAVIHGDIKDRDDVLYEFKENSDVQILLSSEVGSEGLDLQFCDSLVNYDLPWNPMVVEQRIGRIDRFGQESKKVNIYNMIVAGSIQESIYSRLLDRIGIFKGCIGDLETILDKEIERNGEIVSLRDYFNNIEKDLYCNEYTNEEKNEKIESIERAIITEKKNLDDIESGLTNTLTNDSYFESEIVSIQNNYRYITETELVNFVKAAIRDKLTTCQLTLKDDRCYEFSVPKSNKKELINFLIRYQPEGDDTNVLFRQFINILDDVSEFTLTFNQDKAYSDKKLIYANIYHPIILAILNYYKVESKPIDNTFKFCINRSTVQKLTKTSQTIKLEAGEYYLGIFNYSLTRNSYGCQIKRNYIRPLVYDRINQCVIVDKELCDEFLGLSQLYASIYDSTQDRSDVEEAFLEFCTEIDEVVHEEYYKAQIDVESHKQMQKQHIADYYDFRIKEQEAKIDDLEFALLYAYDEAIKRKIRNVIGGHNLQITNLTKERDEKNEQIDNNDVFLETAELVSLSQVTVL